MIQDIEKVIRTRKSIRTYADEAIKPETRQLIIDFMQSNSIGIFGNKVDFYWIDGGSDEFKDVKLGTYGVISGTKSFMTGKVGNLDKNFEDFGYCMEKLVLYCTQLNIGTCWLGGTYKKTAFSEAIDLQEDELIPAVVPAGYFGTKKRTIDKMFRYFAGSDNRKPFDELFFSKTFTEQLSDKEKETYGFFLEMVRLAHSASNKQPWRVVVDNKVLHFFLKRTPNYAKNMLHADLQRVDMGIAISHFELALNEKNIAHRWIVNKPVLDLDDLTEYTASCEML
jgi:nitroreductase